MNIHSTAIIEEGAEIHESVIVGPYAVIGKDVKIGMGTKVCTHAVIEGRTVLGENNFIGIGVVIGNPPQDLKYNGEDTEVVIGSNNTIREYVTINRGTVDRKKTLMGDNILLMAYVHIAHDCIVGSNAILANCATLAGHVTIEENAIIGGLTPIHQFVRIGRYAIVGGGSRVPKDVPPYCRLAGNPLKVYGLNIVGLTRSNFSKEDKEQLSTAYRIIFRSGLNTTQAVSRIKTDSKLTSSHVKDLVEFIENSKRGITKS